MSQRDPDAQSDPTVSDDDSSNQGLPSENYPPSEMVGGDYPDELDDVESRERRLDHTRWGDGRSTPTPGFLDPSGDEVTAGDDHEPELLAEYADDERSPEGNAIHIIDD